MTESEFAIEVLDLGKPIIDFTVVDHGYIWVFVDGEHQVDHKPADAPENNCAVRLVHWREGKVGLTRSTFALSELNLCPVCRNCRAKLHTTTFVSEHDMSFAWCVTSYFSPCFKIDITI